VLTRPPKSMQLRDDVLQRHDGFARRAEKKLRSLIGLASIWMRLATAQLAAQALLLAPPSSSRFYLKTPAMAGRAASSFPAGWLKRRRE